MKVAFVGNTEKIAYVFGGGRRETIEGRAKVLLGVVDPSDPRLDDVEIVFSTWGMPVLSDEQAPKLKAVFYAAGTVDYFAEPLLRRGVLVSSAWHANAIPVAEFTLSQILLSFKGYFQNIVDNRHGHFPTQARGVYGETVALLGAGAVGTKLIELLKISALKVVVFDPFMTDERAAELGVRRVSLIDAFAEGYIVSNHLLNVPATVGMITGQLLGSMRQGATFINTGRGQTVDTDALVRVLESRPDLTALLDVTYPEPLPNDHRLRSIPNAFISSHIAGAMGDEVLRLADCAIEEFDRFCRGETLRYRITSVAS